MEFGFACFENWGIVDDVEPSSSAPFQASTGHRPSLKRALRTALARERCSPDGECLKMFIREIVDELVSLGLALVFGKGVCDD